MPKIKKTLFTIAILLFANSGLSAPLHSESFEDLSDLQIIAPKQELKVKKFTEPAFDKAQTVAVLNKYAYLDPKHLIPFDLLQTAILFYEWNIDSVENQTRLSVVNFAAHSSHERFFMIDMNTGFVEALHVAHGTNSDPDNDGYADQFSNTPGSLMSSLGFYYVNEEYQGQHGRSVRLDGLSQTNSNVRDRAIVIHGAAYVWDQDIQQGRTWGCLAFSEKKIDYVIDHLSNGSLIYAGLAQ